MRIALFDKTKHTKWYIREDGAILSSTTYHSDGRLRVVLPNKNKRGYLYARTSNGNYQVHRLVASAFIPNVHNKDYVDHIDFDRTNNSVTNLRWCTQKENIRHSIDAGRIVHTKNSGRLKYSNEQCRKVLMNIESGMTYVEAGAEFSMPYSTVAHLARGSRRKV